MADGAKASRERLEREQELRLDLRALADALYVDHLRPSQRPWGPCPACEAVAAAKRRRRR